MQRAKRRQRACGMLSVNRREGRRRHDAGGMRPRTRFWLWGAVALASGLALRLWFAHAIPWMIGDTLIYGAIAKNWLTTGVYGFAVQNGGVTPTLIRLPGYPLFDAMCFRLFGMEHYRAIINVQILVD